jgi:hypothetical protein
MIFHYIYSLEQKKIFFTILIHPFYVLIQNISYFKSAIIFYYTLLLCQLKYKMLESQLVLKLIL